MPLCYDVAPLWALDAVSVLGLPGRRENMLIGIAVQRLTTTREHSKMHQQHRPPVVVQEPHRQPVPDVVQVHVSRHLFLTHRRWVISSAVTKWMMLMAVHTTMWSKLWFMCRLRNDLYCVGWGVKLYSLTHSLHANTDLDFPVNHALFCTALTDGCRLAEDTVKSFILSWDVIRVICAR